MRFYYDEIAFDQLPPVCDECGIVSVYVWAKFIAGIYMKKKNDKRHSNTE